MNITESLRYYYLFGEKSNEKIIQRKAMDNEK